MIFWLYVLQALLIIGIPLILALYIYRSKRASLAHWISVVLFSAIYLCNMYYYSTWCGVGTYWRLLLPLILGVAVSLRLRRAFGPNSIQVKKPSSWLATAIVILGAVYSAFSLPVIQHFRKFDRAASHELLFPMRGAGYYVFQGGSDPMINHHFLVPAQQYALDIVKLNSFGMRAAGLYPRGLDAYQIFRTEVDAPCSGEVVALESGLLDQVAGAMLPQKPAGNYIAIACNGLTVLLAHLNAGSIKVKIGQRIMMGDVLALVGNTGNTTEPHLHIHAVLGKHAKEDEFLYTATGTPILYRTGASPARFLIRNDQIDAP